MNKNKINFYILLLNIFLLMLAVIIDNDDVDYSFYNILRIILTFSFGYLFLNTENKNEKYMFIFLAIVFNPIIKINLDYEVWRLFDSFVILFLMVYLYLKTNLKNNYNKIIDIAESKYIAENICSNKVNMFFIQLFTLSLGVIFINSEKNTFYKKFDSYYICGYIIGIIDFANQMNNISEFKQKDLEGFIMSILCAVNKEIKIFSSGIDILARRDMILETSNEINKPSSFVKGTYDAFEDFKDNFRIFLLSKKSEYDFLKFFMENKILKNLSNYLLN